MVGKGVVRWLSAAVLSVALVVAAVVPGGAVGSPRGGGGDTPVLWAGAQPLTTDEEAEARLLALDTAFTTRRTAGDRQLSSDQAGADRSKAAGDAAAIRSQRLQTSATPTTFNSTWVGLGPNPIVQVTRSGNGIFTAMSGRIGALAIRPSTHQFILGAAQGGIWLYDPTTGTWTPETDNLASLSIGALAVAPSNDSIVYAGTGEGALSGDSYFGNGIMKSTDGGVTWAHVSGDYFTAVSISALVVDPNNANHLFVSVLRGRGGAKRVTPPDHSRFGIWESKNGGKSWKLLKLARSESNGATDIALDPQNTKILYASFWGDAIYKSTDGGEHWAKIMTGLPAGADYTVGPTRFSISLSHPVGQSAVLYTGFDWNIGTVHQLARIFKSTNEGASWTMLPAGTGVDSVADYCGAQCWYDNVIEADPTNPNVVYAAGQFAYDIGSGGIFRSDNGGMTWKNLGWNQHPDFHALAIDPSNTKNVLIGSDGGVWFSGDQGGRQVGAVDEGDVTAADWANLNGSVDPNSAGVTGRTGLQIAQFTSVATVPTNVNRFWGGTQDNGTIRKSSASNTFFDVASGDGGQVLVDPTDANYVYGTYFGITPYRYTDAGLFFFTNQYITNGINLTDRSDFYIPMTMNQLDPNQLFLGTYRLYRTDNAKADAAGDVKWTAISPDLTGGCTATAPNGARTCALSAIGVGGGQAVYTGSLDGYVYMSVDAQVNPHPTWIRLGASGQNGEEKGHGNDGSGRAKLPRRPVSQIAVDRSNYRTAYIAYAGFNGATPHRTGHVFKTRDGGATWKDISSNLPDSPVNSIVLDPSYPNTLYAGTDVGPFVTHNGGANWQALGKGFPIVSIWQMDMDPYHRVLAAGTHGRGAFKLTDTTKAVPALVLTKADAGVPVGPGSKIDYTLTLHNIGNADATGVTITDPIPANTSFVSADSGGTYANGKVTWSGLAVSKGAAGTGGSTSVKFTVRISPSLSSRVKSIVNDGYKAKSAEGPSTTGSPQITPIAPPHAVSVTPATQTDGTRVGTSVNYTVTVKNLGYLTDSFNMSTSGGTYKVSILDAACAAPLATTPSLAPGATANVCLKVDVPSTATNAAVNTATVKATSAASPSVSASATIVTIAVAVNTLLVDQDGNKPDVQLYYSTALNDAHVPFSTWDLAVDANIPLHFMQSFKHIVWFTGTSYPGPLSHYETKLQTYLDGGGRLFMSGQDILDQAAGTTSFVHDYLHINWDGSEAQNDKATAHVNGVTGNPVTNGIGAVVLNKSVLGGTNFMDRITPIAPATAAFKDDSTQPDALSFSNPSAPYKVVFLAFAFEEYGAPADRSDLVTRVMTFFGP
jgi:uncharacterized repeat protein (TIGR01451 family)